MPPNSSRAGAWRVVRAPRPIALTACIACVVGLIAAACAPIGASWTYDPSIGQATTGASGEASAVPSAEASVPPASPGLPGSPQPPGSPASSGSATVLLLKAQNVAFDQKTLTAQANTAFAIQFTNADQGVAHNVAIYSDSSASHSLFRGDIVTGPTETTYSVTALQPGTYYFQCDVHPQQMNGTLQVP